MNNRILNKICYFLQTPEKLLSSSKNFTVKRFRNIRWKNRIYFMDNRIKLINCNYIVYNVEEGCKEIWYKCGKIHRDDIAPKTGLTLPAIILEDGSKYWYKEGKLHCYDIDPDTGLTLPAQIWGTRLKLWRKDGEKHRDNIDPETGLQLPAEIWEDGTQFFHKNGIEFIPK
jgi:hypothetical protein